MIFTGTGFSLPRSFICKMLIVLCKGLSSQGLLIINSGYTILNILLTFLYFIPGAIYRRVLKMTAILCNFIPRLTEQPNYLLKTICLYNYLMKSNIIAILPLFYFNYLYNVLQSYSDCITKGTMLKMDYLINSVNHIIPPPQL